SHTQQRAYWINHGDDGRVLQTVGNRETQGAQEGGNQVPKSEKPNGLKKLKTMSIRVRLRYGGTHISENFPSRCTCATTCMGSVSGWPISFSTRCSIWAIAALASSSR